VAFSEKKEVRFFCLLEELGPLSVWLHGGAIWGLNVLGFLGGWEALGGGGGAYPLGEKNPRRPFSLKVNSSGDERRGSGA